MATISQPTLPHVSPDPSAEPRMAKPPLGNGIALLTGGIDPPYVYGLSMEIVAQQIALEVVGSDALDRPEMHSTVGLRFINLHGSSGNGGRLARVYEVLRAYLRLMVYASTAKPKIFHVLWNNKFPAFDRTLLTLWYKVCRKRIVFTAHNVNAAKRDGNDSWLNRVTLKIQYRLVDHIFVHTAKMKTELLEEFGVADQAVTVIPFGINNSVPDTDLTPAEARQRLGIGESDKTILFFGRMRPYKGLEYLVEAFHRLVSKDKNYRLIIAGETKKDTVQQVAAIQETIARGPAPDRVVQHFEFIADSDTELYFKAADVSVLPYTMVFQSGVLFLSFSFGLPVIATEVGSLGDDIVAGENGFMCRPCDVEDLERVIEKYFESDLHRNLDLQRHEIRRQANAQHSWSEVGKRTRSVYERLPR